MKAGAEGVNGLSPSYEIVEIDGAWTGGSIFAIRQCMGHSLNPVYTIMLLYYYTPLCGVCMDHRTGET